ncbi:PREDICTED: 1,4-dihydroxy-2-naphthoyl-CoA thioesterase 1-like isoform X2 [Nelumbo nucifera]|uniref:1,4-dihydroxy-2-naphthoyl-CoA thioesterase 1-like isoform X2 n=1 Tax=Nelumbo nucifera TaxID=4432 RepID=A0A1U8BDR5_NELNU|nr:PREDICTED: 1,4-dihydroxy-2-naphthoyl-CoA thioesterase 1-like isoform X2 [Nelumbo nucifera]XP_010279677.1 PREDICTED: 1,4-dihydroxy-2-naphthoyl-CoA thioesterase 1-like isoform X2 [Nelumbo nucifera]XP_010279678.1 PREDICTED: 1,4-dihydroxy-2-naphthoyl-CoA thioesterase 1-like isoform X2 [Nelumbo nucifera]XP_010279679.1 PREDICTED: 1,4-dihydroxy-2-naphthoyl-CoA thioesterase 1-like isoform X2 [Nelumbo nucifera]
MAESERQRMISSSEISSKTASLDPALHAFGFQMDEISPKRLTGRLQVTEKCCQRFKVLHGGISALIAESLASMGAHMASGFKRIAGIQLSINHIRSANLGDLVMAEARPINAGNTIQVWEVKLWKLNHTSPSSDRALISSSRVTFLSNMPVPENAIHAADPLKKYARL